MKIIAHRGYWLVDDEKNTEAAFERALSENFGIETDLRDYCGNIVISHDIPDTCSMRFEYFLELYVRHTEGCLSKPILALNIKSDGLSHLVLEMLKRYEVTEYFVFDMSVPDSLSYINVGLKMFSRQSEFEVTPCLYDHSAGVWLDCFLNTWFSEGLLTSHLEAGKGICIVSPELHQRTNFITEQWSSLLKHPRLSDLTLCTDFPKKAQEYFNVG